MCVCVCFLGETKRKCGQVAVAAATHSQTTSGANDSLVLQLLLCLLFVAVVACLPKQAAANGPLQQQQQLSLLFAFAIVVCVHLIMIFRC